MKNQAQLIAYVDRISAGTFRDLHGLLDGPLSGVFGGVHVLPFFHPIDGEDAGFDPIDHTQVDARLGTWDDVAALAAGRDVMADVIVNHISRRSPQFADYDAHGNASPWAGMFLTYSHVFPHGASESDLLALQTLQPRLPFTRHRTAHGDEVLLWTTFTSKQVDIDVHHVEGRRYLDAILARLHAAGVRAIRLDAVGFVVKKAGTNCFMIPETFTLIDDMTSRARALGMEVLVEVHGHYQDQVDVARHVDWVYDFVLPPLMLHTLYTRDATRLMHWIDIRPRNAVTVLDTHDGIGVNDAGADRRRRAPGLLTAAEIASIVETIHRRSRGQSRDASGNAASNLDADQINCTFYGALGGNDAEYLIARAIQCFVPGLPQVYYVGLFAGRNDIELLRRTGVGRDINRRYYSRDELQREFERPVVQALLALLRLRNQYPAFSGTFHAAASSPTALVLAWANGEATIRLDVDLAQMRASVSGSNAGSGQEAPVWTAALQA